MLEMIPVVSGRVSEIGYDPEVATVYVRFAKDGRGWSCRNVPPDVWEQFLASESKGQFIHQTLDGYEHGPADI